MGCGVYQCPPRRIATEMRDVLLEPEFRGWFRRVLIAIRSKPAEGVSKFAIFQDVFRGVIV
jgi:hypothetical protein